MSKSANINPPVNQEKGEFYRGRLWKYREPGLPLYPFVVEEIRRLNSPGKLQNYHAYYLVILLTEGAVTHCYESEEKLLVPGSVMIIPPGFFSFFADVGYHKYLVGLAGCGMEQIFSDFGLNAFMTITADSPALLKVFHRLYRNLGKKSSGNIPEILGDCFRLLARIALAGRIQESKQGASLAEKIRLQLEREIANPYSLRELAEHFGIPLSSLHRIFHDKFGVSPKRYQFEFRVRCALELLEMSNLSIKEIAYRTGFKNQYYFSNAVKKEYHNSPSELRRFLQSRCDVVLPPKNT